MAHAEELVERQLAGPRAVISKLIIENFKCIRSLEVKLAPLTIFVGPNGSGKSSILEALALMAQAASAGVSLLSEKARKGPLLSIEDGDALFRDKRMDKWLGLGIIIEPQKEECVAIQNEFMNDKENVPAILGTPAAKEIDEGIREIGYINKVSKYGFWHTISINGREVMKSIREHGKSRDTYPDWVIPFAEEKFPLDFFATSKGFTLCFTREIINTIRKRIAIKRVKLISAERGIIPWYKKALHEFSNYVGRRGEHVLEIIAWLMKPENEERRLPYELLSEEFGIEHPWAGWHREDILTSDYRDPWTHTAGLKLPLLGYGSRQLVPVIAQLAISEPGDIIMVEEPEMSLHPEYQAKLPILFGRAVMEGKQLLITTHSSYFPLSLPVVFDGYTLEGETTGGYRRYEVKLRPEDVAIYHVTRGPDGYTQVERLKLDEDGLREGIPSFIEVEKRILSRYLEGG